MRQTDRPAEAEALLRRAQDVYAEALGDDHPRVNLMRALISLILTDTDRADEAETIAREALARFDPDAAQSHPWYHIATIALAESLARSGRFDEAEGYFLEAIQSLRGITGDKAPPTQSGIRRLIAFYESSGQAEKAAEVRPLLID